MDPSIRFKAAFKTALAMVVAYGIALSMDWHNPYWAGLAVAMCSLSGLGESLRKGLLRVSGTLIAIPVTLTLLASFPQDRWLFMLFMSIYIAFCTYMMAGTFRYYFWICAGFSVPLLALAGGPEGLNAFETVILRGQETSLGVVAYSLVHILVWPVDSASAFEQRVRELAATQRELFGRYGALATDGSDVEGAEALSARVTQAAAGLREQLDAAVIDSYQVWETRHAWRRCTSGLTRLTDALERWSHGFEETKELDLPHLVPGYGTFQAEIDRRLDQIGRMLAGQAPTARPVAQEPRFEAERLSELSHFHRAAAFLFRERLEEIDQLTQELFATVADIRGFGPATVRALPSTTPALPAALDAERFAGVARQFATTWLALLALIYIPDLPASTAFICIAVSLSMMIAVIMPQIRATLVLVPGLVAVAFAGSIHVLIMPHLSGFAGLSLLIFAAVFIIGYLFHQPQQIVGKSVGLAMFVVLASIDNAQQYSFLKVANVALVLPLVIMLLAITTYFPISFRPEDVFLRLLRRFFRSAAFLTESIRWRPGHVPTRLERLRLAIHAHNVATLPGKLAVWGPALPPAALGGAPPGQVQALVTSAQALAHRVQDLLKARDHPQAEFLVRELLDDMRAWRLGIQTRFLSIAEAPEAAEFVSFREKLDAVLGRLETRVEQTLDSASETDVSAADGDNMYRLLGAYRGVSEALVAYARRASEIDWPRLREARF
jgi:uncharacterized membrane protein YccC